MADQFEKDFQRLQGTLKKIATALNDRAVTLRLARKCREIIYRRLKSGYGVDNDKENVDTVNRVKLKELSASYIQWRKGLAIYFTNKNGKTIRLGAYDTKKGFTYNNDGVATGTTRRKVYNEKLKITAPILGEFGRPEKSNATLSGQMLNAITIDASTGGFRIFIADSPRKKTHPKRNDNKLTNKEVAEHYFKTRPGFALTAGEVRILKQECETIIREKIKQLIRE